MSDKTYTIALAGNPNVGKSTLFNALTGLHQHTGNWTGKTVEAATGKIKYNGIEATIVDLPGTYSLYAYTEEEKATMDYICFEEPDAVVVVCDATCMERNLELVLQVRKITENTVVAVNLMDEAEKKGIKIDIDGLERLLGVPVVAVTARSKHGLSELTEAALTVKSYGKNPIHTDYPQKISDAIHVLRGELGEYGSEWIAMMLLNDEPETVERLKEKLPSGVYAKAIYTAKLLRGMLLKSGFEPELIYEILSDGIKHKSEEILSKTVKTVGRERNTRDKRIDKVTVGKKWGIPLMLLLVAAVLFITISAANYPSDFLMKYLFTFEGWLEEKLTVAGAPQFFIGLFISGGLRTLFWVVSVMLPPMAIFFPMFTLLEDAGYLPRVAFNLDRCFKKACTCGKQSLTMCMGFGCNAVGITGARIIDSKREKLIAILTNCFVPCNGRFPILITLAGLFFATASAFSDLAVAGILTLMIALSVMLSLFVSWILSKTVIKGEPTPLILELPPYRRPQFLKVIVRSLYDRTLKVLARAAAVAFPAGCIIWILSNTFIGGESLLSYFCGALDPVARFIGLDGVILVSFILGFPANEIVLPLILMCYSSTGVLTDITATEEIRMLLVSNGWTIVTAVCTVIFVFNHFPCSTSLITVYKETKSLKWTALSFALPLAVGVILCFIAKTVLTLLI